MNPGIYMPHIPKIPKLEFRAEGFNESRTKEFGAGFVYSDDRRFLDAYTNDGYLMGSWIGRAGMADLLVFASQQSAVGIPASDGGPSVY